MIDLHIIDSGRHAKNLRHQVERASHPSITVHVAQPVWGNTAEARRRAYALGSHPFVSWMDDDDVVLDVSWVDQALQILRDPDVSAVYPRWVGLGLGVAGGAIVTPVHEWRLMTCHRAWLPHAHHLTIMRRENVARFFADVGDRVMMRDQDLLLVASQPRYGRLVALPDMAYRWIFRADSPSQQPAPEPVTRWAVEYWAQTVRQVRAAEATA